MNNTEYENALTDTHGDADAMLGACVHSIKSMEAVPQKIVEHADCKGEQAPEDCLVQCIADCRAVLDMPNAKLTG
jgi:hypothetical protein